MRVYRVNMKQIVLHLSGYLAEFRQIAPENAVPGHAAQMKRHMVRGAQQLHKKSQIAQIMAEIIINEPAVLAQ